jgi:hypothetical protein
MRFQSSKTVFLIFSANPDLCASGDCVDGKCQSVEGDTCSETTDCLTQTPALTCVPKTVSTRTPQVSTLEQSGNPIPALLGQETATGRAKIQNTIEFFVFQAPKIFQQKLQKY